MAGRAVFVSLVCLGLAPGCLDPYEEFQDADILTFDEPADVQPGDELPAVDAAISLAPAPMPTCGDGRLDPGEECDHAGNTRDDGACTSQCRLATCGDGLVQVGVEQCDRGAANADDAACTSQCRLATCGDGLVHADVEECDAGSGHSDDYGGCRKDCTRAEYCGDMTLQPDHEECDEGADNGSGRSAAERVPCNADCTQRARRVFVTAQVFTADFGGLDGADLVCRLAAAAAGLPDADHFRAWLSDDTGSPQTRFDHGDAFAGVPYVLGDGHRLADDFEHLISDGPSRPIDITETGEPLAPEFPVWTGTSFTGDTFDAEAHCNRWSSTDPALAPVRIGMASPAPEATDAWHDHRHYTSWDSTACAGVWRLYCFEQ